MSYSTYKFDRFFLISNVEFLELISGNASFMQGLRFYKSLNEAVSAKNLTGKVSAKILHFSSSGDFSLIAR